MTASITYVRLQDWKKNALSMQPAARKPATKKRSSTDGADQLGHSAGSAAGAKRVRRDSHTAASKGGAVAEEEEDQSSMMKQAKDRPGDYRPSPRHRPSPHTPRAHTAHTHRTHTAPAPPRARHLPGQPLA